MEGAATVIAGGFAAADGGCVLYTPAGEPPGAGEGASGDRIGSLTMAAVLPRRTAFGVADFGGDADFAHPGRKSSSPSTLVGVRAVSAWRLTMSMTASVVARGPRNRRARRAAAASTQLKWFWELFCFETVKTKQPKSPQHAACVRS